MKRSGSLGMRPHLEHVKVILQRLRKAGLTVKPKKCQFVWTIVCTLAMWLVEGEYNQIEVHKVEAVEQFAVPATKRQVRAFLGLTGYYRRFIPDYASVATPLTDLAKKVAPNNVVWNE